MRLPNSRQSYQRIKKSWSQFSNWNQLILQNFIRYWKRSNHLLVRDIKSYILKHPFMIRFKKYWNHANESVLGSKRELLRSIFSSITITSGSQEVLIRSSRTFALKISGQSWILTRNQPRNWERTWRIRTTIIIAATWRITNQSERSVLEHD
jgi:hypothetical protein